jgi:hypothetical protein
MPQGQRLALLGVAVVIAVVAFVLIRPGQGEREPAGTRSSEQPASRPAGRGEGTTRRSQAAPQPPTIRLRGGKPVGGVNDLTVKSGQRIRFAVVSDEPVELHVHGYDRYVDVRPGRTARVSFPATVEGVFEIESHATATEIASLRVVP